MCDVCCMDNGDECQIALIMLVYAKWEVRCSTCLGLWLKVPIMKNVLPISRKSLNRLHCMLTCFVFGAHMKPWLEGIEYGRNLFQLECIWLIHLTFILYFCLKKNTIFDVLYNIFSCCDLCITYGKWTFLHGIC
jgi:hypothetical protein